MIHNFKVYCRYEPRPIGYCLTSDRVYLYGQMTHYSWRLKVSRNPADTFVILVSIWRARVKFTSHPAWWAASYGPGLHKGPGSLSHICQPHTDRERRDTAGAAGTAGLRAQTRQSRAARRLGSITALLTCGKHSNVLTLHSEAVN